MVGAALMTFCLGELRDTAAARHRQSLRRQVSLAMLNKIRECYSVSLALDTQLSLTQAAPKSDEPNPEDNPDFIQTPAPRLQHSGFARTDGSCGLSIILRTQLQPAPWIQSHESVCTYR